jgi:hypothetical protein
MEFAMSFLSNAFRRKSDGLPPWAALDQESLRISAAMEHVRDHGNLDSFAGNQNEKLALMLTASRQGLVQWDRAGERYGLTSLGRERLGMRRALEQTGGPMNLPPAAPAPAGRFLTLGSGTILAGIAGVAIGAAAVALLPGSSKLPPRDRAAVAAASKPSDAGNAPRRDEASPARNPGIPCLAEKCLETGGSAERPAQQAGVHPGRAGAVEGALLAQQLAPAAAEPAPQPPRRAAERARTHQAAPAINPEQPGYAQSTGEPPARAADKSSRNRHAAIEPRQSWSGSKHKSSKSRREYVEEEAGEPEQGAIVRRDPEPDDGPPAFTTRRYRGEQVRRRGGDEENPPGYAYREPQGYGYRQNPRRFGPFDWLFR